MRKHGMVWSLRLLLVAFAFALVPAAFGDILVSSGVRVNAFQGDGDQETDGSEVTVPVSIRYVRERFSLDVTTSYSAALIHRADIGDAELAHATDTLISAAYTLPQLPLGLFCFGSLSVNLPTGKARLTAQEQEATIGSHHDFFEIEQFGEGLNIGGSFNVLRQFGKVTSGLSATYVYKGEYDPTGETADDDLDPGDLMLLAGLANWEISSRFKLSTLASYSYVLADTVNGHDDFQQGGSFTLNGTIAYLHHPFGGTIGLMGTAFRDNKELVSGALEREPNNSNGPESSVLLDVSYTHSPSLVVRTVGDIRYYGESARRDIGTDLPYSGRRIRYSIGPGARYAVNKNFAVFALAKYFLIDEEESIFVDHATTYRGMTANFEVTYIF